ncbi:hypothetical protein ACFVMC_00270 [Nocardia sp. NPDC127579]|uniref:hypothetical protein n=1 Tax=Nocardia sp. NPDC127579 TaxID=3345402 RepID=UPI0036334FBA
MNDLAALFTATGVGSVLTALVAGLFGWRVRSANVAQIAAEMSRQVAADVRADNERLEARFEACQASVDSLRDRVGELSDALHRAIVRLDEYGHDTASMKAVLYGRTNGHSR